MRKLAAVLFTCILAISLNSNMVWASELPMQQNERIERRQLSSKELKGIYAYGILPDGNKEDMEIISAELVAVTNESTNARYLDTNESTEYTLSIMAREVKVKEDINRLDGATAQCLINWTDNPGTGNVLNAVGGSWTGTLTDKRYLVYNGRTCIVNQSCNGNGFSQHFENKTGFSFKLETRATTTAGNSLIVRVETSIFD